MIKIGTDGLLEIEADDVSQMMQEASMLIMGVVRQVQDVLPDDVPLDVLPDEVPLDFLVQDLFKSLRYAVLLDDGKTKEEALEILNGKVQNKPQEPELPEIDLGE